jgi:hypothetical protein
MLTALTDGVIVKGSLPGARGWIVRKVVTAEIVTYFLHDPKVTTIGPLANPGNVALKVFFMLVINDIIIYTWSNEPCCTSLSRFLSNNNQDR